MTGLTWQDSMSSVSACRTGCKAWCVRAYVMRALVRETPCDTRCLGPAPLSKLVSEAPWKGCIP